ncbi:stage II sporulation protein D [Paenibacillus protaetiae]|uniref:Stage II sporulation protein D n=2 Tax=Paenibacillus protaetiae TaxID=2509456 RepID=A0A4P6EZI7_9BACL|nr:stage II sporulation protein D [Paenibacillus protaetiae]
MAGISLLLIQLILAERLAPWQLTARSVMPDQVQAAHLQQPAGGDDRRPAPAVQAPAASGSQPSAQPRHAAAVSGGTAGASAGEAPAGSKQDPIVRVYLTKEKRIESVPLETYVKGAVAGEMPIDFEPEALKAQAIAARTYIVRRLEKNDRSGVPVAGADVTDTEQHQMYVPLSRLGSNWPEAQREADLAKLSKAVEDTKGLVVAYGDEPIEAVFFSTSNGYTENSEDYWQESIPYLRSVASPWDKELSPAYKETVTFTLSDFYSKLGISPAGKSKSPAIKVLKWTDGKRIAEVRIAGREFSGREVREKLELASAQFAWKVKGDSIVITTYGSGHGIGMSQWGADGMAKEGRSAEQILAYYYTGTKVEQASKLVNRS